LWRWLSGSSAAAEPPPGLRDGRSRRRRHLEEAAPAVGAVARVEGGLGRADAHQHLGVDAEGGRRLEHGGLVDARALEHARQRGQVGAPVGGVDLVRDRPPLGLGPAADQRPEPGHVVAEGRAGREPEGARRDGERADEGQRRRARRERAADGEPAAEPGRPEHAEGEDDAREGEEIRPQALAREPARHVPERPEHADQRGREQCHGLEAPSRPRAPPARRRPPPAPPRLPPRPRRHRSLPRP
jgi:hypothetical protein